MRSTMLLAPVIVSFALVSAETALAFVEVDGCGQVVNSNGAAFLAADLDCTGHTGPAVILGNGVSLNLGAFTLTGGDGIGVTCHSTCTVFSQPPGGSVVGSGEHGIDNIFFQPWAGTVTVRDVIVSGNAGVGVRVAGTIAATRATITNNGGGGLSAIKSKVRDSFVMDNGDHGVVGQTSIRSTVISGNDGNGIHPGAFKAPKVKDSEIAANSAYGIGVAFTGGTKIKDSIISANGLSGVQRGVHRRSRVVVRGSSVTLNQLHGIEAHAGKLDETDVSANFVDGVLLVRESGTGASRPYKIRRSTITGNGRHGVGQPADPQLHGFHDLKPVDSVLIGNGTGPGCGMTEVCADIAATTTHPPQLVGTSQCDTSYVGGTGVPGISFGVCSLD